MKLKTTANIFILAGMFLLHHAALAATVTVSSYVSGYGVDGGSSGGYQLDGQFDYLNTSGDTVYVRQIQSLDFTKETEFRGAYEFQAPDILNDNIEINSVNLRLHSTYTFWNYVYIYGYQGNGQIELSDFAQTDTRAASSDLTIYNGYANRTYLVDVTDYILNNVNSGNGYIGFNIEQAFWNDYVDLTKNAELIVDYTVVPLPPAMLLFLSGITGFILFTRKSFRQ